MIKRLMLKIVISIIVCAATYAQNEPINVTFFGSSVCKGTGAVDNRGYAWQLFHNGTIDTVKYKYINASRGGDNTIKIERDSRMKNDLFPTDPAIVVIGLSLGNEGIGTPKDDNGREQILEQFRSRLLAMTDSLNSLNIKPVIVNCYANTNFTPAQYDCTKRINRMINTWDYPSVNVLGTVDDLEGKWVEGYVRDPLHPNTAGHEEMSYAFVPSLFDAMMMGKKTPTYDWNNSYTTLKNERQVEQPISIEIEHTMHSFTMSFRFKETEQGSIAGFILDKENNTISITDDKLQYKTLAINYAKAPDTWKHVVLSHSYANQNTMLFLDGVLVGSIKEQLSPEQVYFGGTASTTELKDITLHRAALNESEALDLFNKKFIQSSLEFYNPLTKPTQGNALTNYAQSMTTPKIDTNVVLQHNEVKF